jgi:hypothetical protein
MMSSVFIQSYDDDIYCVVDWCDVQVQDRFDVDIKPLPDKIDSSTYMNTA